MSEQENLDKQTQHAQTMAEKLWLAERKVEEMEVNRETRDKRTSEQSCTISRLEEEVEEYLSACLSVRQITTDYICSK